LAHSSAIISTLPNHPGRSKRWKLSIVRLVPPARRTSSEAARAVLQP
jgi:hypothetical protein